MDFSTLTGVSNPFGSNVPNTPLKSSINIGVVIMGALLYLPVGQGEISTATTCNCNEITSFHTL